MKIITMKRIKYTLFHRLLLLVGLLIVSNISWGQQSVTGKVVDTEGIPLPGVNVVVTGTTNGSVTSLSGTFSIMANPEDVLEFSFIGLATQSITVGTQSVIDVILQPDLEQLDEIVVVGYGTMRKSDVTGSVASVEMTEAVTMQAQTVDQMLKGRIAGVQMVGNDASPNSGVSIKIRGGSSLRGDNEPLYVVDGVIMSGVGEDAGGAIGGSRTESQNGLNGINPKDIESMEILKDASATAIYGSRGANGVVLITTKSGKKGENRVSAYANYSVVEVDNKIDVLNGPDYANYMNEAGYLPFKYHVDGNQVYSVFENNDGSTTNKPIESVNFQDEMYQVGQSFSAGASLAGGGEKGTHFFSLGYNDLAGVTKNSSLQNANVRVNLKQNLAQKLQLTTNLSGYYGKGSAFEDPDQWGGDRSLLFTTLVRRPFRGENVQDAQDNQGQVDPIEAMSDYNDNSKEYRLLGNVSLKYDIMEGLTFTSSLGGNYRDKERTQWFGKQTFLGRDGNGVLGIGKLDSYQYNINNILNYMKQLGNDHRINAMAGFAFEEKYRNNSVYGVADFLLHDFKGSQPQYAKKVLTPFNQLSQQENLMSYMGRANYSFRDRYIVTATMRIDGSSKFAPENRYGYFPSLALAWRASEEQFIKNLEFISDLKLRGGVGQIGNQSIAPYSTTTNFRGINNGEDVNIVQVNIGNPDLKWEVTQQANVGLDFGFLDSRITGVVDAYMKHTSDLLQLAEMPKTSGFDKMYINRGSFDTKGIEVSLNGAIIRNEEKGIYLNLGGNIAINRSQIGDLGDATSPIYIDGKLEEKSYYLGNRVGNHSPYNIFMEGAQPGLFYGYQTAGVYQEGDTDIPEGGQPGDLRIVDQNGDGEIDETDFTVIGNPNPEIIFGLTLDFSWKRLSLMAQFDGSYGNEIANANYMRIGVADGQFNNILTDTYENAWRPERTSNTHPRIGTNLDQYKALFDVAVEDGSYFRLNNVTISYNLPLEKFVEKCNIYVTGGNLFTLSNYKGYSPIVTSYMWDPTISGVDWMNPPNSRSITIGFNANF